jgi:hypothetical protein
MQLLVSYLQLLRGILKLGGPLLDPQLQLVLCATQLLLGLFDASDISAGCDEVIANWNACEPEILV